MKVKIENLCRLCAKEHQFLKDCLDESNKSILDLIRHFTQITITECDNMTTKVCLDCEEKLVTFQLFILECYKVQDSLPKLYSKSCEELKIKVEDNIIDYDLSSEVKPEVGEELTADELFSAINNQQGDVENISRNDSHNYSNDYDSNGHDDEDNDDDDDEITIAALKKVKPKNESDKTGVKRQKLANKYDGEKNIKLQDLIRFECTVCKKDCLSWDRLRRHSVRMHRTRAIVKCNCGITLKSKSTMYKHVQDHKNPSSLSCDQCSKILLSEEALNKHKYRHIPKSDRKYVCSLCNKVFKTRDCLKSHEKSHIPIENRKVFNCTMCDLKFTTPSSANSHKRVVHFKVKSYICDQCGYACGTNGELRQHRAIHSDEKPFVCSMCPKRFKTYSNLKTHMDTHESTSYECYICHRVLNSRRTLRKHLLVHEDKCGHVCSFCNKAFKRRQTLKVHLHTHTGDKPLSCKWCDERFSYASTLRSHRLRAHPDKMAGHVNVEYSTYIAHPRVATQEDYIKSDLTAISGPKNEMESIQ